MASSLTDGPALKFMAVTRAHVLGASSTSRTGCELPTACRSSATQEGSARIAETGIGTNAVGGVPGLQNTDDDHHHQGNVRG